MLKRLAFALIGCVAFCNAAFAESRGPVSAEQLPSLSATGGSAGTPTVPRTSQSRLLDPPIYAADYGEKCNGSFDNAAVYKQALADAVAQGRGVQFGAGTCLVGSQVTFSGALSYMRGVSENATAVTSVFNGPIFHWTVNGTGNLSIEGFRIYDMTWRAQTSYAATTTATAASTTTSFTVASATNIAVGQEVIGAGVPGATGVTAISGTTITVNQAVNIASGASLSFVAYGGTTGLLLDGDNTSLWQHGSIDHIRTQGMYAGITIAKNASSTSFGNQSNADWVSYDNITCENGALPGQFCIWFTVGSGTGNTFTSMRTTITGAGTGVTPVNTVALRFDGSGNTVGDIVITNGHFGGVYAPIGIGQGTVYRANVMINASQLDAGVLNMADLASDTPFFARMLFAGDNVGGGVLINTPLLANSIVTDQLVDERRAGTGGFTIGNSSSAVSTNLFQITSGQSSNSNFYGGTSCDLTVNGLIAGVAGGVTYAHYLLPYSPSGFGTPVLDRQVQSTQSSSFFTFGATATNGTVNIYVTYTAASGGLINDAQIVCKGGVYALRRLL